MTYLYDPHCRSTADVARQVGCRPWHIRRICEKGLLPEPPRVGRQRAFRPSDLPALRAALAKVGYLKS